MVSPKKTFLAVVSLLLVVISVFPQPLFASQKQYFDYGPYYSTSQVLGFSFSSLENLPALKVPDNLIPAKASGVLPDSPFYFFEKVAENTQLTFTFDPVKKEQLRVSFAAERLTEAKTLMDQGKTGPASQALNDYSRTLDTLAQNLPAIAQRNDPASQQLLTQVEKVTADQAVAATALSLTSSPAQAENWTEAQNTARQVLDKITESKGESAIPQDLSTSLQQLKEQGLISEEESGKIYSLKNRGEVREELNKLASSGGIPPSELLKLDTSVAKYYPDVQKQEIANWQIVELRSYQSLPQPTEEIIEQLEKWQNQSNIPPSNDIKPYLWYTRASDLAQKVDLSNFTSEQQTEAVKSYPAIAANPTYSPPPSPTPTPSPSPAADNTSPVPSATPLSSAPPASPPPVPVEPYLEETVGALPGQPTYILKQLGEGFSLAFTFDPAEKARLQMQVAERRLAEAEALSSDPKKASLYEATLKNYQQAVNTASTFVKELKDPKIAKQAAERLESQSARHEVVFEKGLLPAPAENPNLISDVINAAEDAMDRSADVLDRPALPPQLASRLGDLKAQGLILEEEAADLVKSATREEARSKIRKLLEAQTFPLADAKKLDEAQSFVNSTDYNQLVEVRKVEELQNLRSVQTDLAQTPTLKSQATNLAQKEAVLTSSFDPALINKEDLAGKENLVKTYEKLSSIPRPINGGQFGSEATPGAKPAATPLPQDAVLTACPEGAVFKQYEGCVWADSGKKLNDYDQYKCEGPRQYYSFAVRKCVAYDSSQGYQQDAQPVCPVGYQWSWQNQSCQTSTGGILPWPSPSAQPEPKDEKEIEERSKSCPEGSSYKPPQGCVWDDDGKSVYDSEQYRCNGRGQYYSFEQGKCVAAPKEGEPYPKDTSPACKEPDTYWNWSQGKCVKTVEAVAATPQAINIDEVRPNFATPGNPFYFLKQAAERVQEFTAFTPEAREQVRASQAKERLAEAIDASKREDETGIKNALSAYTSTMQNLVSDLSKAQLSDTAKNQISKNLAQSSVEQNLLLQKLQALAGAEQDTPISAAVSATILGVDKAADIGGEPPIPADVKEKIEALPEKMISDGDKKKLLEMKSRVEARLTLGGLIANGALTQTDTNFLNEDFDKVDQNTKIKVEELKKLEEIATATESKDKLDEKIKKNEDVAQKLQEFEKTFEVGQEVPVEIRPYVRLTRINEVTQTIRPDLVRLNEFQNRKDIQLAVATLQEEFKPTAENFGKIEEFRRRNPSSPLPPDLARVEALSYNLGVRREAGPCFLPTPPFAPNTPCPAAGAAIPVTSYYSFVTLYAPEDPGSLNPSIPSTDKDGKPLVYGQGPKPASPGVCPSDSHWMYDSGGWCMSNSGNYSSSYSYTPTGTGAGYTPYSSYYTAPGAPPATYGYPAAGGNYNYSSYSPPSYYGTAPTYYTTNPPAGTVPGSGPKPTSPGQCPSGYHWMSDSGGWCMADGPTYVPSGSYQSSYPAGATTSETPPSGGYNCGSQPYDPVTKRCKDGACPGGFNWDGSKCVASSPYYSPNLTQSSCGPGYYWDGRGCIPTYSGGNSNGGSYSSSGGGYSPGSYQYGCTPGYYWDGSKCVAGSNEGSGWSDTAARSQSWCQPPSNGCGSNSYWDYGSCYCRSSSTYSGGSGPSPSNQCQGLSCGGGAWLDYSTCSCKYSGGSGTSSTGSTITCYPPSAGCPGGWYDYSSCSCKTSSYSTGSSGGTSGGSSSGSCPSGSHWMSENGGYCMSDAERDAASTGGSSGGSSSSGSCPSGYHWMDNSWCMQDGSGSTSTPAPTSTNSTPTPTSQPEQQQQTPQPTSQPEQQQQSTPQPEQQQSTPQPASSPSS
ncbi:hypothetical protein HY383_02365 [Candidatus Daviesbacteria bacterium]|nr:hypothetical protein [Candidatus Daviesbacteria bacterium]